ncbi:hypothetical protein [Rhodococcus sp. NPDC004095]
MSDAAQAWREAVSVAQDEIRSLESDYSQMGSTWDSLESHAAMLDNSTVDTEATYEDSVVRGGRLHDVVLPGVADIRQAIIEVTNRIDDLRRAMDFYHH